MARDERPPDWTDWVSAAETYNYCNKNTLIDWFNLFGTAAGFVADSHRPGYDKRFDYVSFMLRQSWAFREKFLRWLSTAYEVRTIAGNASQARDPAKVEETLAAINQRVPIIAHAVLWNREDRIVGMPTLLVRSDVLAGLRPLPTLPQI